MKIRILSDLHLEFAELPLEHAGEDLLILAGDIGIHTQGVQYAKRMANKLQVPVVIIAGNHEFYQNYLSRTHTWEGTLDDLRREADHTTKIIKGEVTFLENAYADYEGVRFIGCTLWTDMKLYGDDPLVQWQVSNGMNDYRVIMSADTEDSLRPDQSIRRHGESRQFLENTLGLTRDGDDGFTGKVVVITHHTPSWDSVPKQYRGDKISAGYSSRLEPFIEEFKPAIWCHGHTHTTFDYMIGETRIICNPRGYDALAENPEFEINKIVEV